MDGRAHPADVGHVGAAGRRVVAHVLDAVRGHVGPEALGQDRVVAHRRGPTRVGHLDGRAGGHGGRLGHGREGGLHLLVVGLIVAAQHEPGRGPVRDDVGRRPALADDAVDPRRRAQLLAPQPDRAEQQDERVERVLALPRVGRGVRLQAAEHDVDVLGRQWPALDVVAVARVVQQGGIEAGEQAVVDHDLLATPPLLGGRAQEHDLAGQLVGDGGQGEGRGDTRGGHRVVAAAVAQPGQGVVLGEDPDTRAGALAATREGGPDGGRQAARRMLHGEPALAQDVGDPGRGLDLLEGRLRVGVDAMRQLDDERRGRPRRRRPRGPSARRGARRGWSWSGRARALLGWRSRWSVQGTARIGAGVSAPPTGSPRRRPPGPG